MEESWDAPIARFRAVAADRAAQRAYFGLLVEAQERWQDSVAVHPWRLDVLGLYSRPESQNQVWAEHRVRDGQQVMVFKLGPLDSINSEQIVTGDICRLETAPAVLDSFLLQIAHPVGDG